MGVQEAHGQVRRLCLLSCTNPFRSSSRASIVTNGLNSELCNISSQCSSKAVRPVLKVCDVRILISLILGNTRWSIAVRELVRAAIAMGVSGRAEGFLRDWLDAEVEFRRQGGRLSRNFAVCHYAAFMYPPEVLNAPTLWALT